ncbi:L,D-transpeptidase [Moraxella caviae]|uniref:L,D-transpeptidase n=1 Tax=Moraxella caviae TaxID=34060 RepID=A0A1S9ZW83_9GAMM|nr:L,D-transpeptidase [Moraxella caviae]OOR87715.1 L,D-transpeptidase [Moraxella caviae]STZ10124.1 L,D-transpeptidase [Moraxella caviae]VEW11106.1 L,D-transpeptidase [Moraxella caviae]
MVISQTKTLTDAPAQGVSVVVDTKTQTLSLYQDEKAGKLAVRPDGTPAVFLVSTAKNGTGQLENTGCTPLGKHVIAQKIGDDMPVGAVFVARQFTGEVYDDELAAQFAERDWILSRILWLKGVEAGKNLGQTADGACCDTFARYIYIHGTPDTEPMGEPKSHGCVRMRNDELVWLYEQVAVGTPVRIV